MRILIWLLAGSLYFSCSNENNSVNEKVEEFINLYQDRQDFEKFLSLYDKNMVLEDMITGYRVEGRDQFAAFFNWPDERFEKRAEKTLVVQTLIIEGRKATIQGYFNPFSWNGSEVEAMQFTTLLYFNDEGKITKHVDWINYPNSLIDYSTRGNANDWIK